LSAPSVDVLLGKKTMNCLSCDVEAGKAKTLIEGTDGKVYQGPTNDES